MRKDITLKPPKPVRVWAPIGHSRYGHEWIVYSCLAYSRTEAKRLLLLGMEFDDPERERIFVAGYRFARVSVALEAR